MNIIILILSSIIIFLCLLQDDKNEGILSLGAKKYKDKTKTAQEKLLQISTSIVGISLFICLFLSMIL